MLVTLEKGYIPFAWNGNGKVWQLISWDRSGNRDAVFGNYKTKADAKRDVRLYGLKLVSEQSGRL